MDIKVQPAQMGNKRIKSIGSVLGIVEQVDDPLQLMQLVQLEDAQVDKVLLDHLGQLGQVDLE